MCQHSVDEGHHLLHSNQCMHAVLILQMALLVPVLMSVVWTGPAHAAKKSRQVREVWLL